MKKKTKIIISAVGLLMLIITVFLTVYLVSVAKYKKAITNMTFVHTDASEIADGTYIGECDVEFIYAKVEVTVAGGLITDIIILKYDHGRGEGAEEIVQAIIASQIIDVDYIAGVTNSSQVIKKAVDNALGTTKVQ